MKAEINVCVDGRAGNSLDGRAEFKLCTKFGCPASFAADLLCEHTALDFNPTDPSSRLSLDTWYMYQGPWPRLAEALDLYLANPTSIPTAPI